MKLAAFLLLPLFISTKAFAVPAEIERDSYIQWLESINSNISPYVHYAFDWFEEQQGAPLPQEVFASPDLLHVTVETPIAITDEMEGWGEVERGTTYGAETYGIVDAPISMVLEAILFRWGKPIGETQGTTYPIDTVYGYRKERLSPYWGEGSYRTMTHKSQGGIALEQNDISSFLVRGNAQDGYVLVGSFMAPNGKTISTNSISIILIRPIEDGRTDYRVLGMYNGQSYLMFGIELGRRNFGFNQAKIYAGQLDFYGSVDELKRTGKISEGRPK